MILKLRNIAFAIVVLLMLAKCSSDVDMPQPTACRFIDIVTLFNSEKGLKFELQRSADSEIIPLQTQQFLVDTIIRDGTRMIIHYEAEFSDTSLRPMPVKLLQIGSVAFDTVRSGLEKIIKRLPSPQLKMQSIWRTGNYLNLQAKIEYDGTPRSFAIIADNATLDSPQVDCYIYNVGKPVGENYIDTKIYGSFYIGNLWQLPNLQRLRIYDKGINDKTSFIDIVKK